MPPLPGHALRIRWPRRRAERARVHRRVVRPALPRQSSHRRARRVPDVPVRCADGSLMRWSFVDTTPDSFTWRGELSTDGGATWRLEAEFFGRRMAGAGDR